MYPRTLAHGFLRCRNGMRHLRRPLCLHIHIVHDGDIGGMGFGADEGALGALHTAIGKLTIVETILTEGVSTANQQTRLQFASCSIVFLAQWAVQPHGSLSLLVGCIFLFCTGDKE